MRKWSNWTICQTQELQTEIEELARILDIIGSWQSLTLNILTEGSMTQNQSHWWGCKKGKDVSGSHSKKIMWNLFCQFLKKIFTSIDKFPGLARLLALRWSSSSFVMFFVKQITTDHGTLLPFRTSWNKIKK